MVVGSTSSLAAPSRRKKLVTDNLLLQMQNCQTMRTDFTDSGNEDEDNSKSEESPQEPEPEAMGIVEELENQIKSSSSNIAALELEKERTRLRLLEEMQQAQRLSNRLSVLDKAAADYQ